MPITPEDMVSDHKNVVEVINGLHSRFPYRPRHRPADFQPLLEDYRYNPGYAVRPTPQGRLGYTRAIDTGIEIPEEGQLVIAWHQNRPLLPWNYSYFALRIYSCYGFRRLNAGSPVANPWEPVEGDWDQGNWTLPTRQLTGSRTIGLDSDGIVRVASWDVDLRVFNYPILARTPDNHLLAAANNPVWVGYHPNSGYYYDPSNLNGYYSLTVLHHH